MTKCCWIEHIQTEFVHPEFDNEIALQLPNPDSYIRALQHIDADKLNLRNQIRNKDGSIKNQIISR